MNRSLFPPLFRTVTPVAILLAVLLLLATYVRIDFLRSVDHQMSPDAVNYDAMARQLLDKGVYAYHDTEPNAFVTPGYPLLLAGVYAVVGYDSHDPLPYVRYLQALFGVVSVWLVYRIAAKLAGEPAGLLAAAITAVYPPFIWMNGAILTESFAVFALLAYILAQLMAIERSSRTAAAVAGVLLGVTVLIRPEFLPIVAVVYGFVLLRGGRSNRGDAWRLAAYSCAGLVLVMLPWWIRNAVTLHEWVLTATQANPLSAGTYPYKQYDDGLIDRTGLTDRQIAIERLRVGFSTQPWLFLKWYTVGKLRYIYEYMYAGGGFTPAYPVLPLRDPHKLHLAIVWSSVAGMALLLRRWRQLATVPVLIVVVMSLIRLAFVPEYRYNITVMPLMIVIGCAALAQLTHRLLYGSRPKEVEPMNRLLRQRNQLKLLIIVPAYNEAGHIRRVVGDIRRAVPDADIAVVNDGSTDATGAEAALAGATVLDLPYNLGIGGAVQTGFRYAARHGYDVAVQIDGDGQHDPADLHLLLGALETTGADMAIGSRFLEKAGYQSTFSRLIGIRLLAWLVSLLTRQKATDPTSGYRACGRRAIALFADHYPADYPEVEALALMHRQGLRFAETPVTMKPRASGQSSITPLRSAYYMVKVTLALLIHHRLHAASSHKPQPAAGVETEGSA